MALNLLLAKHHVISCITNTFLGKILYKNLGCWHENERLQGLTSLEGTDDLLMEPYKSRRNAITKCAALARKRNFKGSIFFLYLITKYLYIG